MTDRALTMIEGVEVAMLEETVTRMKDDDIGSSVSFRHKMIDEFNRQKSDLDFRIAESEAIIEILRAEQARRSSLTDGD